MSRYMKWFIIVALASSMVTVAAGCGGDTGQAKQYLTNAEKIIGNTQSMNEKTQNTQKALESDIQAGKVTTSAQYNQKVNEIKALMDSAKKESDKAKPELEKILKLKGVEDYIKYARLRLESLSFYRSLFDKNEKIFEIVGRAIAAGETGQQLDVAALDMEVKALTDEIKGIAQKASSLKEQISSLVKEKKLL